MSSLLCANIFFESTQNTGITYAGSNTVNILSGGSTIGTINTTSISVNNIVFNTNSYVSVGNSTVNTTHSPTSFAVNGNNISPFNFRNKIINGSMMLDQRNSGANTTLSTNNNVYSLDRWWGQVAANTTGCVILRATDAPTGYLNSLKVQRTASNTGTSAITVGQVIESFNCYDLQGQTITLSFWAKAGANLSNTSIGITVKSGTTADEGMAKYANNTWTGTSSVISTSQVISNTWTKYTFTTASALGSSIAELGVSFSYTPVGTAGINDWFEITGVQLESGSVATPFELRHFNHELSMCQRYYQTTYGLGVVPGTATRNGLVGSIASAFDGTTWYTARISMPFIITMRVAPTILYWDGAGNSSKLSSYFTGTWTDNISPGGTVSSTIATTIGTNSFTVDGGSTGSINRSGINPDFHYTASAEL